MIKTKMKMCAGFDGNSHEAYIYKNINGLKYCKECSFKLKEKGSPTRNSSIKPKFKKPTGELDFFKSEFEKRGGFCEVTGKPILFNVFSCCHLLTKGSYGKFRLKPENLLFVLPEIHILWEFSSREKLLSKYPEAEFMYERRDALKSEYYNGVDN